MVDKWWMACVRVHVCIVYGVSVVYGWCMVSVYIVGTWWMVCEFTWWYTYRLDRLHQTGHDVHGVSVSICGGWWIHVDGVYVCTCTCVWCSCV